MRTSMTEENGSVEILIPMTHSENKNITRVDPFMFISPVKRLGVSGGTAPFFALKLRGLDGQRKSETHYIGKDLSRATDEIEFYEEMLRLKRRCPSSSSLASSSEGSDEREGDQELGRLLDFAFEYAGVLTTHEMINEDDEENTETKERKYGNAMDLLVLRNLRDGQIQLRMLDIKMGQQTAQAGWQGKSRSHAYRQKLMDCFTNSHAEGYRLEGFDGMPNALKSRDPLLAINVTADVVADVVGTSSHRQPSKKSMRKAERMLLQSLKGYEIFMHFMDVNHFNISQDEGSKAFSSTSASSSSDSAYSSNYYPAPVYAEIILDEIVRRLTRLAVVCHQVTIPQKWIGSSIALGYDVGCPPPPLSTSETSIRSKVLVNIFDWGRSELNTHQKNLQLSPSEQADRSKFWNYYLDGINQLSWNAAKAYHHRFCCTSWEQFHISIYDFDSMSPDDLMGEIWIPVKATNGIRKCALWAGKKGKKTVGTVSYSISYKKAPEYANHRIKGWWNVRLVQASHLPIKDHGSRSSDPYCLVTATSEGKGGGRSNSNNDGTTAQQHHRESKGRQTQRQRYRLDQVTSVKTRTLNPVWYETLSFPVATHSSDALLAEALEWGGKGMSRRSKNKSYDHDSDDETDDDSGEASTSKCKGAASTGKSIYKLFEDKKSVKDALMERLSSSSVLSSCSCNGEDAVDEELSSGIKEWEERVKLASQR